MVGQLAGLELTAFDWFSWFRSIRSSLHGLLPLATFFLIEDVTKVYMKDIERPKIYVKLEEKTNWWWCVGFHSCFCSCLNRQLYLQT